jgi:diaminohydroxyphosphoribosylaminopyrimidine deaminase/5-amino-6-(5-phosphoribosylamino)uracil reductase
MVGVGTVLADDPRLTARMGEHENDGSPELKRGGVIERQPARLVLDTNLRTPLDSRLVADAGVARTIVACGAAASDSSAAALERAGVTIWRCGLRDGRLDVHDVLRRAADEGLISVLSEGGGAVATTLLESGLVDRVAFFVAPRVYGAGGVPALGELDPRWWKAGRTMARGRWTTIGDDCLFEAEVTDADPNAGEEG